MRGSEAWMVVNERPALTMVRGHGSWLYDELGREYLDFIQGWAVNCLGHSPEIVARAIVEQASAVLNVGPAFHNAPALSLTSELARISGLGKVFLANSGAEANEGAVKLARKWGQRNRGGAFEVLTTVDGFHGRTLAMTCATGKAGWSNAFPPAVEGFPKIPFGDVEAARAAITPNTVAILVEPIQGEAGVVVPPEGYLRALRRLCDEEGILLLCDEIQTGLARTGPIFAFAAEGIHPDIVTLGKGLGAGLPAAAILAKSEVACFELGDHGSTFGGNALVAAGALAVVRTLVSEDFERKRSASSVALEAALGRVAQMHGATLRGRGHLFAMLLPAPNADAVRRRALELGLLLNSPRPHILRFMPALDVGDAEIAKMEATLDRALRELDAETAA